MRLLLVVLTALVFALAACGGDDDDGGSGSSGGSSGAAASDEDQIKAAIDAFAANEGNPCDLLTDRFVEETFESRESCQKESEESKGEDAFDIEYEDIAVDGDEATAKIKADGNAGTITLLQEGDEWLIDKLETGG
jgi:ABC-type glycerol-3-phosphate transport system substrate-binding protein